MYICSNYLLAGILIIVKFYIFQFIMLFALATFGPVEYDQYVYPWQGNFIGWCIALSSILCIPGFAIFQFARTPGTLREVICLRISYA